MFHFIHKRLIRQWTSICMGSVLMIFSYYGFQTLVMDERATVFNSALFSTGAFVCSAFFLWKVVQRPFVSPVRYVLPVVSIFFIGAFLLILLFRVEYSRLGLILGSSVSVVSLLFLAFSSLSLASERKVAFIANFNVSAFIENSGLSGTVLSEPRVSRSDMPDVLIVDMHKPLEPEWQRFLAELSLMRVPVYHVASVFESLEGRVDTRCLHENSVGGLLVDNVYERFKRLIDLIVCLLLLPLAIPLVIIFSLLIALVLRESPIFIQNRVGQGGKCFNLIKLKSMRSEREASTGFASEHVNRIPPIGQFVRKYRVDELPQIFNVLVGHMSLIGPRPEQPAYVEQFNTQIPFYKYRHLVKPGITGWAQVEQGYADSLESTEKKLSYDLFYIKNFSVWLDVIIVFKTIRTVLTGFGAR